MMLLTSTQLLLALHHFWNVMMSLGWTVAHSSMLTANGLSYGITYNAHLDSSICICSSESRFEDKTALCSAKNRIDLIITMGFFLCCIATGGKIFVLSRSFVFSKRSNAKPRGYKFETGHSIYYSLAIQWLNLVISFPMVHTRPV